MVGTLLRYNNILMICMFGEKELKLICIEAI